MSEAVDRPEHYIKGGLECIDVIKAVTGDKFEGFLEGNAIKYLWRWKDKNGVEDLKKCRRYLDWMIEEEEGGKDENV